MSDIEKDIKRCEQLTKPEHANWIGISNQLAIAHIVDRVKEVENDLTTVYLKGYADAEEKYKKRIKELEEENYVQKIALLENSIPKQKVKEILIEIQEEYNKLDKEIDKQIKDKNKDYYKCKENIAIMQTLAYCRDKFEGLLEEK